MSPVTAPEPARSHTVASVVLAAVFAAQVFALLNPFVRWVNERPEQFWPFLDYPMYRDVRREGDAIPRYRLTGLTADGQRQPITPQDLGLNHFTFSWSLVPAMQRGDVQKMRLYATMYATRSGRKVTGFELERHPLEITRAGLAERPAEPVARVVW